MTMPKMMKTISMAAALACGLAMTAPAAAAPIVTNGDFATGTFAGWTLGTVGANGTLGAAPYPRVTAANPFGAPFAAEFNVGRTTVSGSGDQGGSLSQIVFLPGGQIDFTAQIASFNPAGAAQSYAGLFQVFIDGTLEAQINLGAIAGNATETGVLSFSDVFAAGNHSLEIRITRQALSLNDPNPSLELDASPRQYLTNVALSVPEPGTVALLVGGLIVFVLLSRRRRTIAQS